jgi:hypothetical protein
MCHKQSAVERLLDEMREESPCDTITPLMRSLGISREQAWIAYKIVQMRISDEVRNALALAAPCA